MKLRRWMAAAAALVCLIGCGHGKEEPAETGADPEVLTGVYREAWTASFDAEDGYRVSEAVRPCYDPEADTLTVCLEKTVEDENGQPMSVERILAVRSAEGETISSVPLPASDEITFDGVITASSFLWRGQRIGNREEVTLNRCARDGSDPVTVNCAERYGEGANLLIGYSGIGPTLMERDGVILMAADSRLFLLDDRLELKNSFDARETVWSVGFLSDGSPVYTVSEKAFRLDPASLRETLCDKTPLGIQFFLIGEDGELYCDAKEGVFRRDGGESVLVMNKRNSGLSEDLALLSVRDGENLVYRSEGAAGAVYTVVKHAPDIDLSDVKTITVAAVYPLKSYVDLRIREYNRTHPETLVVIDDRSNGQYELENAEQLAFEMTNGTAKPDILISPGTDPAAKLLLSKGMYADLLPYLEKDREVRAEDLFASVRTAYSDKNGGLWGIPPYFMVRTVMGRRDVLGAYADKGSWTLSEFVDFASSLPPTSAVGPGIRQESLETVLGAAGYNSWIDYDAGTCDFSGEDFAAFLRFLKTLPKDYEEFDRRYPFSAEAAAGDFAAFRDGRFALAFYYLNGVAGILDYQTRFGTFGTDDLIFMGYPTVNGKKSNVISGSEVMMITSFCEDPDAAWGVIRSLFAPPEGETDWLNGEYAAMFPSLKSVFARDRAAQEAYYRCETIDTHIWSYVKKEGCDLEALKKVNYVYEMKPEFLDFIEAMLDDGGVTAILDYTPDGIREIILEEISAYLGKDGSEADCAGLIESRVSIWLAEHH